MTECVLFPNEIDKIDHCAEVCRCAAPTIFFPAAKRPAFVYNQHGFIRKETEKATHVCQNIFEVVEVEGQREGI